MASVAFPALEAFFDLENLDCLQMAVALELAVGRMVEHLAKIADFRHDLVQLPSDAFPFVALPSAALPSLVLSSATLPLAMVLSVAHSRVLEHYAEVAAVVVVAAVALEPVETSVPTEQLGVAVAAIDCLGH